MKDIIIYVSCSKGDILVSLNNYTKITFADYWVGGRDSWDSLPITQ